MATMISKETFRFLQQLTLNNDKVWFDANRSLYTRLRKEFEEFLDVVISEVAKVLAEGLGPSATVARWGGEEFLILFTETRLTAAVAAMERARKAVEVFVGVDGDGSAVTLSAGLAAASGDFPWDITVRVADALLYDAKEAGRNRIRYAQVRGGVEEWEPEP